MIKVFLQYYQLHGPLGIPFQVDQSTSDVSGHSIHGLSRTKVFLGNLFLKQKCKVHLMCFCVVTGNLFCILYKKRPKYFFVFLGAPLQKSIWKNTFVIQYTQNTPASEYFYSLSEYFVRSQNHLFTKFIFSWTRSTAHEIFPEHPTPV